MCVAVQEQKPSVDVGTQEMQDDVLGAGRLVQMLTDMQTKLYVRWKPIDGLMKEAMRDKMTFAVVMVEELHQWLLK